MINGSPIALPRALQNRAGPQTSTRTGIVVDVIDNFFLVCNIGGTEITNMPYLNSYSPTPGDNCQVLFKDGTWLCLGTVGPGKGSIMVADNIVAPVNTGTSAGTEYAVHTTANFACYPFRVYGIKHINGRLLSLAVQQPSVNLRNGPGVGGTLLMRGSRWEIVTTNQDHPFDPQFAFCNNSSDIVTTSVTLTINPSVATLVTYDAAAAPGNTIFIVQDIGNIIEIPGLTSV